MAQCPRGNQRFNTHDALVLNYAQMLREAGFLTRTEPRNEFIHIDGTAKRPDLQVYNFKGGRACFDVSVTHPALLRHGHSTVPEAGKAAGKREQEKFSKYKEIAKAAGMTFHPLVHEAHARTSGHLSPQSSQDLCREDSSTQASTCGERHPLLTSKAFPCTPNLSGSSGPRALP